MGPHPNRSGSPTGRAVSQRIEGLIEQDRFLLELVTTTAGQASPDACDFLFGNPQELPLPELVESLRQAALPRNKSWFAYTTSDAGAQTTAAASLRERFGIAFEPEDICMTCGTFGALAMALQAILDPGDEVVYNAPAWPFYALLVRAAGGQPVEVDTRDEDWDLDLDAIGQAISPKTRAVIVNTPNNPTGRIYPRQTLTALAEVLEAASERNGRPVYLLSDESYNRIVFDERHFLTPTAHYPSSFLLYTYGKTSLAPGLRIGYAALAPSMQERDRVREALVMAQIASGWAFPSAILQHALGDLEKLSIDLKSLQRKRDRMVSALRSFGYEVRSPEGTFYLLPRAPEEAARFVGRLRDHNILVVPGSGKLGRHFRISMTASEETVERSLKGFEAAFMEATAARSA